MLVYCAVAAVLLPVGFGAWRFIARRNQSAGTAGTAPPVQDADRKVAVPPRPPADTGNLIVTQLVDKAAGFEAIVITVPREENRGFAVLDVESKTEDDNIRSRWDPARHDLMINGGYFNPDFSPTGFCKVDNRTISSTMSRTLSGFVAIDNDGTLDLLTRSDDLGAYPTVMQAGPYVIDPGGRVGIRSRSGSRSRRTLVGLTDGRDLVVVVTEPIFLLDLAYAVEKHLPRVERLLNLDGGPSTALMTGSHTIVNMWPVRNYISREKRGR